MTKKVATSVYLEPGQVDKLHQLAYQLGYIHKRGPAAFKMGSIGQLMQAIARGEIELKRKEGEK